VPLFQTPSAVDIFLELVSGQRPDDTGCSAQRVRSLLLPVMARQPDHDLGITITLWLLAERLYQEGCREAAHASLASYARRSPPNEPSRGWVPVMAMSDGSSTWSWWHHDGIMITSWWLTEGLPRGGPRFTRTPRARIARGPPATSASEAGWAPVMAHHPDHKCITITLWLLTEGAAKTREA